MSEEGLAETIGVQVAQLEERLSAQNREIHRRLEELQLSHEALAAAVLARLDAHEEYHGRNEHRWGMLKLARRYPFRLAAIAGALAVAGNSAMNQSRDWLGDLLGRLAEILVP